MTIGANWAEIWAAVWKAVWTQTPAVAATQEDEGPGIAKPRRRAKLSVYKKPPEPKKKAVKKAKLKKAPSKPKIKPIEIEPVSPFSEYAASRQAHPPVEAVIDATLEGCTFSATASLTNVARLVATLDGCDMYARVKLYRYDDSISAFMRMPELEPEVIEL